MRAGDEAVTRTHVAATVAVVGSPLLVLALAWRYRPSPARVHLLGPPGQPRGQQERREGRLGVAVEAVGSRLLGVGGLDTSPERSRRVGVSALAALAAASVSPMLVPLVIAVAWMAPRALTSRHQRRRRAAIATDLPDVVDLLSLAVGAGLSVALAVREVGRRGTGPVAVELRRACAEVALGRRLADTLDDLVHPRRGGEAVRGLVAALVACERYGAPLVPALHRLSLEVRADRRRSAEEAARKIPVKLLFPLVTCTLPAFALLTVAPLIASAVRSLRL